VNIYQSRDYKVRVTRPGVLFAVAAVTVTAPRLALAFLAADGVAVPTAWRVDLLAVSSVATAIVLTGGTAYLAHAIAVSTRGRGLLMTLWTAALLCSGALIAPAIVATLRAQPLSVVLGAQQHWAWSICAVLAVDLVASGAMLADARRSVAHPVREAADPSLSTPPHPVQGVDSAVSTPSSLAMPHPCPWGCGRRFATRDAANGHGRHCPVLARSKTATTARDSAAGQPESTPPPPTPSLGWRTAAPAHRPLIDDLSEK